MTSRIEPSNVGSMPIKINLLKLLMSAVLLTAVLANNSHAIDLCADNCENALSMEYQLGADATDYVIIDHSHQDSDDCNDPTHQHKCCHHHNFLSNGQKVLFSINKKKPIGVSPERMFSDPHARGPFQPPRV